MALQILLVPSTKKKGADSFSFFVIFHENVCARSVTVLPNQKMKRMKKSLSPLPGRSGALVSYCLGLVVALFACILTLRKVENFDIWWHIKVGEGIVRDLRIPLQETFSHTMAGTPWTPHEWFAEVIFYLVNSLGGVNALSLFTAAVAGLTAWLCWLRGRRLGAEVWSLAILIVWAFLVARFRFMARPHIFFFLFASTLLFLLESHSSERSGNKGWSLLAIPMLLVCWVNTHGSFPLAYGFLAVWAGWESYSRKRRWPLGIFVLCLPLIIMNPGGVDTLVTMKNLFVKASLTSEIMNEEFSSPSIHGYPYFWSFLALTVSVVVLTFTKKRIGWLEAFTLGLTALLALKSVRFIAIFVIASVPYVAVRLNALLHTACMMRIPVWEKVSNGRLFGAIVLATLMVAGFYESYAPSKAYEWGMGLDEKTVPAGAADFLDQSGLRDIRLYNNFEYGGYLSYRLFPRFAIARDGRAEIFAPLNNAFMLHTTQEYRLMMDRFRFQAAVVTLEPSNGFEKLMRDDPGWVLVYWDDRALVYLRNDTLPPELLSQWQYRYFSPFSLDYSYLQDPVREGKGDAVLAELHRAASTNPSAFKPWIYLGYVNGLMGHNQEAAAAYERSIAINPVLAAGHYGVAGSLGELYLALGDKERALSNFRLHVADHKPRPQDLHRYALIFYDLKAYSEAEKYFTEYLQTAPNDAMALANYGFLLMDTGKLETARKMFSQSTQQQADGPGVYGLALTLQKEGNCTEAVPLWQRFILQNEDKNQIVEQARRYMSECGDLNR